MTEQDRHVDPVVARLNALPLKSLEPVELGAALSAAAQQCGGRTGAEKMRVAIMWAAMAHAGQTRAARGKHEVTSYLEHPLRCALRLHRFGVRDGDVLVGAVLHDTLEDGARELLVLGGDAGAITHAEDVARTHGEGSTAHLVALRDHASQALEHQFGERVAAMVAHVSNPVRGKDDQARAGSRPEAEKNAGYAGHLDAAVTTQDALLIKSTDFIDNAGSLHHTPMLKKVDAKARKYLAAQPVLVARTQELVADPVLRASLLGVHDKIAVRLEDLAASPRPEPTATPRHDPAGQDGPQV